MAGEKDEGEAPRDTYMPKPPPVVVQTVYEAKPAVRDLLKEATARFVPAVVARKKRLARGEGRLMEEAEVERLESEGYVRKGGEGGADEQKATCALEGRTRSKRLTPRGGIWTADR